MAPAMSQVAGERGKDKTAGPTVMQFMAALSLAGKISDLRK